MAIIAHMHLRSEGCTITLSGDTFHAKEEIKKIGFRWTRSDSNTPIACSHWEKTCDDAMSLMITISDLRTLGIGILVIREYFEDFDGELLSIIRKKECH